MQWRSFSAVAPVLALAACVISTQTFYYSPPGATRISEDELRVRADEALNMECPRLLGRGASASGKATFSLAVTRGGTVSRARLDQSSGDRRLDDIFGGLAATLRVWSSEDVRSVEGGVGFAVSYFCSANAAVAAVTRTR